MRKAADVKDNGSSGIHKTAIQEEGAADGMICRWVREYEEAGEEGFQARSDRGTQCGIDHRQKGQR
jgi:hypothetical protein